MVPFPVVNIQLFPSYVALVHPILLLRYQLTSLGLVVPKLYKFNSVSESKRASRWSSLDAGGRL